MGRNADTDVPPSRRDFLVQLGTGAAGVVGLHLLPACEQIDVRAKRAGREVDFITPAEDGVWYWQSGEGISKSDAPEISRAGWSLEVDLPDGGDRTLDFSDLTRLAGDGAETTYVKTMRCIFGASVGTLTDSLVSTGIFRGVPLDRVLEQMSLPDDLAKIRTFGADGFESNLPFDRAMNAGDDRLPVLLAYQLNGRPLSRLRGGPVRLVIPEKWGYKNVKWLTRLEPTPDDDYFGTYETERFGGSDDQEIVDDPARIALMSTVTRPTVDGGELPGPDVLVAGTSFAGGAAIERVELSIDDGPFEPVALPGRNDVEAQLSARLRREFRAAQQSDGPWPPPNVWMTWAERLEGLSKGRHVLTVRASDDQGRSQPSEPDERLEVAGRATVTFTIT